MPDTSKPDAALAEAIRRIRLREGLTQEELADRAGLHSTSVSRYERAENDPPWTFVKQLAAGLGVTALELVALAERIELD